ncbi:MAG: hypothetical protein ACYCX2_03850 [Christensenellales bacterium]
MENQKLCAELERERRKLNRLVNEAMKQGTSITEDKTILEQSRKVDALITKIQAVREKHRQDQPGR